MELIENKIFIIRGQKVMLDKDLAQLYEVETKVLNQSVKRNIERFPNEFMFQLTKEEWLNLKSQFVTSKRGGQRYAPYAFTEHGVAMLSSVLNSKRAIAINIQIIQTFIKIKEFTLSHNELSQRVGELEKYFTNYAKDNEKELDKINETLNYLIDITKPTKVGFTK